MIKRFKTRGPLLSLALIPGIACTAIAQQAFDGGADAPEVIVRVGDDPADEAPPADAQPPAAPGAPAAPQPEAAAPAYWIGVLGGDVSEELRAHLGLEGAGVLVREVVPDSPADKAGIKKFDVLLTANGKPVTEMSTLAGIVREVGDGGQIKFDLLRAGGHQQVAVDPAPRPAAPPQPPAMPGAPAAPPAGVFEQFFGAGEGQPFQFRMFGPGVAVGGANVDIQAPGNTSVQVQTHNGKTHVTVNHNGKTWEVDANDPESMEQLPPEVRPMVEGLIHGQGVNVNVDVQDILPELEGIFEGFGERWAGRRDERLRRRMEALERELDKLRGRLTGEAVEEGGAPAADDVAPAFVPPPAPAAEIELPSEAPADEK